MKVLFDHFITGSPCDFVWTEGQIQVGDLDEWDWKFSSRGARYRCARAASEAAGFNLLETPDIPQAQFWKKHTQHPAWHRIASKAKFVDHLDRQVKRVIEFINDDTSSYYLNQFQVQQRLIDSLEPARVRDASLAEHGFIPDFHNMVEVPCYDNIRSSTGRMTVISGPKILTLQKDLRGSIVSRWDDGILVEVDFNALDARVLGWISGFDPAQGDMYEWIGKNSDAGDAPRSVVKEATLAAMYGMSKRNFALRFQDFPDAIDVYDKVRRLLKVRDLEEALASQARLINAFGRHLNDTSARVSHHVQSSAVDVACSGFDWLVQRVDQKKCLPIFLIHDAIVLDVKNDYIPHLENICKSGLFIPMINQYFPVKIRRF